jgi:hypothetical protein
MLLQEISQILAATRNISASQEEQNLTVITNISASREVIEEKQFHEQHQEDLEETKEPWKSFDEEKTEEPENEEFLPCMSSYPLFIQKINPQILEDLHGMTKEDIQTSANEQINQRHHDYIELWFHTIIGLKHHFILQQFLAPSQSKQLVPHIPVSLKAYLSNLNMSIFVILLRTWIHWKYSYT